MLVRTGAVDLNYQIRSMKTFNPLDQEHSQCDETILACDEFFRKVIFDGRVLVGEKEVSCLESSNDGTATAQHLNDGTATAQHLRDGLIRLKVPTDAPAVGTPWSKASMSH
jgi:hypothetical protein